MSFFSMCSDNCATEKLFGCTILMLPQLTKKRKNMGQRKDIINLPYKN